MKWMKKIAACARADDGLAAMEFALAAPFLLAMFLGTVEISRYVLINQKVEKAAFTVSDVVAQSTSVTTASLNQLIAAASQVMQPYTFGTNGVVIVTSVTKTGTATPKVNWQYKGGGTLNKNSQVGTSVGQDAALPGNLTLADKDNVIIAEVYYNFTPLISSRIIGNTQFYKTATYKPRLGSLGTLG